MKDVPHKWPKKRPEGMETGISKRGLPSETPPGKRAK